MSNLENFPPSPDIPNVEGIKDPFTFQKFCIRIGAIPSSYTEAMTIEEQILYFIDFLQNTVIPAVNNNADTVNELIAQFTELYNYVHDYFDNLDVQEEVNNKLDEMVQDGTLQEIISQYIANTTLVFNTIADMKASTNLLNNSNAKTLGYYNINDGGGSTYKITNIQSDYSILLDNGLFANIQVPADKNINVNQFGCVGDGLTDDFENFNKLLQFAKDNEINIINNINLLIKSPLKLLQGTVTKPLTIRGYGSFTFDFPSIQRNALLISSDYNINILDNLTFDFKNMVFQGIEFHTINSKYVKCKLEGTYKNVRRANTNFTGGNIVEISGSYDLVEVCANIKNGALATGAGISGAQGICGLVVGRYSYQDVTYVPKVVKIKSGTIIDTIYSEDTEYTMDQDGIKIFGDNTTIGIIENGVTIKNCAGRWVKTQCGYSDVSGDYIAETYFPAVAGIDIQWGKANCHDINIYKNISQDSQSYGESIFKYAPDPNNNSNIPTETSFFRNINYYAKEPLSTNYRTRKMFFLTGNVNDVDNLHVLSNCVIENVNAYGMFYEFAQITSNNTNLNNNATNISFNNITVNSLEDNFIDTTKNTVLTNTYVLLSLKNIYVNVNEEFNSCFVNTGANALIKEFINTKGLKTYENTQDTFVENDKTYVVPKTYIPYLSFFRNDNLSIGSNNNASAMSGETISLDSKATAIISGIGRSNQNMILFIIDTNGLEAGIIGVIGQTKTNRTLYELGNNQNVKISGSTGLVLSLTETGDVQITNYNSSTRIVSVYKMA